MTSRYWEWRYRQKGRDSGAGSRGELALHKARIVNDFADRHQIRSTIEWGCGDGVQAKMLNLVNYLGIEVSPTAVEKCRKAMPDRAFIYYPYSISLFKAELVLSMDVIYHLIDDKIYQEYMTKLFDSATRFVGIYSPDEDSEIMNHVRYRKFSDDVPDDWDLIEHYPAHKGSKSEWWFYGKRT